MLSEYDTFIQASFRIFLKVILSSGFVITRGLLVLCYPNMGINWTNVNNVKLKPAFVVTWGWVFIMHAPMHNTPVQYLGNNTLFLYSYFTELIESPATILPALTIYSLMIFSRCIKFPSKLWSHKKIYCLTQSCMNILPVCLCALTILQ